MTLTKPRIMSLLLVTGACGMIVGARGWPGTMPFVLTMLGLALACGGASALNHLLDRDIDRLMGSRTSERPVASGRVAPARALEFGLALSACSFTLLASTVNVLTAVLALVGNLFYVVVYTGYLKRRGPQNIVLGGAAGAVPPLVGYAAATGGLALPAVWLFLIVFLWTPPHFWALALLLRDHYAAANVPMLPVVRGDPATVRRIVWYTIALVAFTVVPFVTGTFGLTYLVCALALGGVFLVLVLRLGNGERRRAAFAFHYSLLYLALLFAAAAVDALRLGSGPRRDRRIPAAGDVEDIPHPGLLMSWNEAGDAEAAGARGDERERRLRAGGERPACEAPLNAGVTVSAPLTMAHEWRMPPRFSQSTTTRQPSGTRTCSSPRP